MKYVSDGDAGLYINGEKVGNPRVDIFGLDATIPLMQSKDYRDRFIAEWAQTRIRIAKLDRMLQRHYSGTLDFEPTCPIILLEKQLLAMKQYADMLEVRAAIENVELPTEKLMEGET
nr:MAG TPA: Thioredoxin-like domain [Caudoviricetes sp.]